MQVNNDFSYVCSNSFFHSHGRQRHFTFVQLQICNRINLPVCTYQDMFKGFMEATNQKYQTDILFAFIL